MTLKFRDKVRKVRVILYGARLIRLLAAFRPVLRQNTPAETQESALLFSYPVSFRGTQRQFFGKYLFGRMFEI